jgi:pimeloyl-ACP methyl ester carboxylesterase
MKNKKLLLILIVIIGLIFYSITWDIPVEELKTKYANDESQFINVDGMQVHYRDEGSGMPIVLLHGSGASLHTWDDWTKELKKNYRVIRLDLPAFGLTGPHPNQDYRIITYSDFLNDFLTKLDIDSMYLAGNSLGGNISWYYASDYPQKVKKLILVDPIGIPTGRELPWIFRMAKTPVINSIIRYVSAKYLIEDNLKQVYFDDSKVTSSLIERYYDLTLREGNRTAFIDRAKTEIKDNSERLINIDIPTQIIWGKDDSWVPVSDGQKYLEKLPNAQLVVIENTGHLPMEESPVESLKAFKEFLELDGIK